MMEEAGRVMRQLNPTLYKILPDNVSNLSAYAVTTTLRMEDAANDPEYFREKGTAMGRCVAQAASKVTAYKRIEFAPLENKGGVVEVTVTIHGFTLDAS